MTEAVECRVLFGPVLNTEDFKVLEVSADLLAELQQADCPLVFKGCAGEPLVLCSATRTFELRSLESSNTLLLAPTSTDPAAPLQVEGSITQHYECKPQPPNVRKLKRLLSECVYTDEEQPATEEPHDLRVTDSFWDPTQGDGPSSSSVPLQSLEHSLDSSATSCPKRAKAAAYTRESLRSQVLCSDGELDAALEELNPIVSPLGHLLLPAPDAVTACLDSLLTIADGGWDIDRFSAQQCMAELKDFYSAPLIRHVLRAYCTPVTEGGDGQEWWALDAPKVCLFRATQLFQANAKWKETDLMAQWRSIVPSGMTPTLEMLRGQVLVHQEGALRTVRWFPRDALPPDPRQRFSRLFECQKKWSKPEIVPFLLDLVGPGLTAEQLLARHAREHQEAGAPHYCRAF